MRKFILITALVLVSASAQAGISRSLTLASNDASATVEQSKAAEAPTSAARQQPSIPQQSGQNPQQNSQSLQQNQRLQQSQRLQQGGQRMQRPGLIATAKYAVAVKVAKLKRQGESTLARVKYAMHRHGSTGEATICNAFVMPGQSSLPRADCLNLSAIPGVGVFRCR